MKLVRSAFAAAAPLALVAPPASAGTAFVAADVGQVAGAVR